MAFDNIPMTKPALMTAAAALALYDKATMTDPASIAGAADALAEVVRRNLTKLDKAPATRAKPTGFRVDLLGALALIGKVVSRRNTIPVLSNVLLQAQGDTLRMVGTDQDQEITVVIDAPGIGTWTTTADADALKRLVTKGSGDVLLSPTVTHLEVMVGEAMSRLPTIGAEDFPAMEMEPRHAFTMDAAPLARMVRFIRPAVSTEETRYYLNGAYLHTTFEAGERKLRLVATDGSRLNLDDMPVTANMPDFPGVIVPRCALDTLAPALVGREEVQVEVSRQHIRFTAGNVTLLSKVVDGAFPDYTRVIPRQNGITYDLDAKAFAAAVTRVSTISNERSRSIKLTFGADRVTLLCQNMEAGRAEEHVPAERRPESTDEIEIGFNARFLEQACAALGAARIQIQMARADAPAVVVDPTSPSRVCVLMPLRV